LESGGHDPSLFIWRCCVVEKEKKILNRAEAVEFLGNIVTAKTMSEWRSSAKRGRGNRGPKFIRVGGRIAYRVVDLERWLVANEVDSDAA
jgi:hypothetical protein